MGLEFNSNLNQFGFGQQPSAGFGFGTSPNTFGGFAPPQGGGGYGGGGGGMDLSALMSGLAPVSPWITAGAQFGGELLSGLGGLISGPSESQKRSRAFGDLAKNRIGQSVLDPAQYMAQYQQSLAPQFNRQAQAIGSRLGLDSGLAQKSLAQGQQSTLAGIMADLTRQAASMQMQNDLGWGQMQLQAAQSA